MELLATKNLSCGYNVKQSVLHGVSLTVQLGEMVCLMGRNGCGKSTLLRTLASLHPPLAGDIILYGRSISNYSVAELSRQLSIVTTSRPALDYLTAEEVVSIGRVPHTNFWGRIKREDRIVIEEVFNLLSIEYLKDRPFNHLSDGQQQLVLIARALAQKGDLIILDEPTTFLDLPHKRAILNALQKIALEDQRSVIFSSHDWELVRQFKVTIWLVDQLGQLKVGKAGEAEVNGEVEALLLVD
jgi:iron complex transport system ATP-binding protein